jgi:hypothetical protein
MSSAQAHWMDLHPLADLAAALMTEAVAGASDV